MDFLYASPSSGAVNNLTIKTGSANPPTTTLVSRSGGNSGTGATVPIRKGKYVSVTSTVATLDIRWYPIGTGGLVKQ